MNNKECKSAIWETKTISNQVTIEISTNDIFNWFTNCRDIETLKYLGKYALTKASYMKTPDNDDFRSRI